MKNIYRLILTISKIKDLNQPINDSNISHVQTIQTHYLFDSNKANSLGTLLQSFLISKYDSTIELLKQLFSEYPNKQLFSNNFGLLNQADYINFQLEEESELLFYQDSDSLLQIQQFAYLPYLKRRLIINKLNLLYLVQPSFKNVPFELTHCQNHQSTNTIHIMCQLCDFQGTCRQCHDDKSDHLLKLKAIFCDFCQKENALDASLKSCHHCSIRQFENMYLCTLCGVVEQLPLETSKFHCLLCNICHFGNILDYSFCQQCKQCFITNENHCCGDLCCSICMENIDPIDQIKLPCCQSHGLHYICYKFYLNTFKTDSLATCPIDRKSIISETSKQIDICASIIQYRRAKVTCYSCVSFSKLYCSSCLQYFYEILSEQFKPLCHFCFNMDLKSVGVCSVDNGEFIQQCRNADRFSWQKIQQQYISVINNIQNDQIENMEAVQYQSLHCQLSSSLQISLDFKSKRDTRQFDGLTLGQVLQLLDK